MRFSDMWVSEELRIVEAEACRWAAAAKLLRATDAELVLAAIDRRGELLEELRAKFPIDRGHFIELMQKRRPSHAFSAAVLPPLDQQVLRLLRGLGEFGRPLELDKAIRAIIAQPSPVLTNLLQSARRTFLPATWLDSQEFWFSSDTSLPGPTGERVPNGPFGNDRMATSRDLDPYLNDPRDDNHLPFCGVTIVVEDSPKNADKKKG